MAQLKITRKKNRWMEMSCQLHAPAVLQTRRGGADSGQVWTFGEETNLLLVPGIRRPARRLVTILTELSRRSPSYRQA